MNNVVRLPKPPARPIAPATVAAAVPQRGYAILYRDGMDCPGCGHGAFHVGRQSAECGRCGTALGLAPAKGAL